MKRNGDPAKSDDSHEVVTRQSVPVSPNPRVSASPRRRVPVSPNPRVSASPRPRVPVSTGPRVSGSSVWRVFCAVEIPQKASALAASHVHKLRTDFPRIAASWNRDGQFHLTLKFLGNIPLNRVDDVSRAAKLATAGFSQFNIIIAGAGAFPEHGPPRVLWLGIEDPDGTLSRLQKSLEHECAALGFEREVRPFHPHLTLARLRRPEGTKELAIAHKRLSFSKVQFSVSEMVVVRSLLNSEAAEYLKISQHSLTGD